MFFFKRAKFKMLGRAGIRFREDGKTLVVDSELLSNGDIVLISIPRQWDAPHQSEPLSIADRERILNELVGYYNDRGTDIEYREDILERD